MANLRNSVCPRCAYVADNKVTICPRCGTRMLAGKRDSRVLGWLFMSLGLFLILIVGVLTFFLGSSLLHPGSTDHAPEFNGTADQAKLRLIFFGVFFLFGLNAMVAGIFQIKTGHMNMVTIILGAVLFVALLIAARTTSKAFR